MSNNVSNLQQPYGMLGGIGVEDGDIGPQFLDMGQFSVTRRFALVDLFPYCAMYTQREKF